MDINKMLVDIDEQVIKRLARVNPRLAYMVTSGYPLDPRTYTIQMTWDTTAIDQPILGNTFPERLYQFFWIWDIVYALRRPNYAPGVFGKLEQDYYAQKQPYVDVEVRVVGMGGRDSITDGLVPVESVFATEPTNRYANKMWVLSHDSNLVVDAINRRTLLETENPYELTLAVSGLELGKNDLPGCDDEWIKSELVKLGALSR